LNDSETEIRKYNFDKITDYSFFVDRPNGIYKGQVLTRLVSRNTTAKMPSTMATVPEIMFK
jgi:hypothetical protein